MCVCVCVSHALCLEPCSAASSRCLSERVNVTQITDASRFLDRAHVLHSSGLYLSTANNKDIQYIQQQKQKKRGKSQNYDM